MDKGKIVFENESETWMPKVEVPLDSLTSITLSRMVSSLRTQLTAVEKERDALREALEFYATSWETHPGDSGPGGNTPQEPVCDPDAALIEDGGAKARAALAEAGIKESVD